jgi:FkbM family methyltransferase
MLSDFEPRLVRQNSCGVKYNCIIADPVAELWYDTPRHDQISLEQALALPLEMDRAAHADWKELGILRDHLVRPGDKVVECGCHHGLTSIMLASWVGQKGFVWAYDAVLLNALVARRNFDLNRIENAAAFCAAIGGRRGIVNCFNESNVIVKAGERTTKSSTLMVMLEDVVPAGVDVLKLDVEGCELDILETSRNVIAKIPRLAIELHTDLLPKDGVQRVFAILKGRSLHVLWENGQFEPYSGQRIAERVHLFSFD